MGGYGSGRRSDRPSTDDCLRLSLSQFKARGMLKRGCMSRREFTWSIDGKVTAEVFVTADIDCLEASPQVTISGWRGGNQIDCKVELVHSPMRFGGERWYAVCPITGRRCSTLVLPPGRSSFASVRGCGVVYSSQRETPIYRAYRAVEKAERRLLGMSKYTRRHTRRNLHNKINASQASAQMEIDKLLHSTI